MIELEPGRRELEGFARIPLGTAAAWCYPGCSSAGREFASCSRNVRPAGRVRVLAGRSGGRPVGPLGDGRAEEGVPRRAVKHGRGEACDRPAARRTRRRHRRADCLHAVRLHQGIAVGGPGGGASVLANRVSRRAGKRGYYGSRPDSACGRESLHARCSAYFARLRWTPHFDAYGGESRFNREVVPSRRRRRSPRAELEDTPDVQAAKQLADGTAGRPAERSPVLAVLRHHWAVCGGGESRRQPTFYV